MPDKKTATRTPVKGPGPQARPVASVASEDGASDQSRSEDVPDLLLECTSCKRAVDYDQLDGVGRCLPCHYLITRLNTHQEREARCHGCHRWFTVAHFTRLPAHHECTTCFRLMDRVRRRD